MRRNCLQLCVCVYVNVFVCTSETVSEWLRLVPSFRYTYECSNDAICLLISFTQLLFCYPV